jgi:hypothetical protein
MNKGSASIEAIVKFFFTQFRNYGNIGVPVKGVVRVKTIPIFSPPEIAPQNRVRLPSLTVLLRVVPRITATLGLRFLRLEPLVSQSVGGTDQRGRVLEGFVRSGKPFRLNEKARTFHPGWARWI